MVKAVIYIEGGGKTNDLRRRCREGFRRLLESSGFRGRMPALVASGSRGEAFKAFRSAHEGAKADYVAMLIDSEDPMEDIEKAWEHLARRDGWKKPEGAEDTHVLLMVTCMETWIVADRRTLEGHYGEKFRESALPPVHDLESRRRQYVQNALEKATENCTNAYQKGKRSFEVLAKLEPSTLKEYLPSFVRVCRILDERL